MKVYRLLYLCALICFGMVFSCKRSLKEKTIGPDMPLASADFKILGDTIGANYFNGLSKAKKDTITFARIDSLRQKTLKNTDTAIAVDVPFNTFFKAQFNESVRWTLTITQNVSLISTEESLLASKTITGISSVIDSSNSSWNGESDGLTHFVQSRPANVTLTIFGSEKVVSRNFYVAKSRAFLMSDGYILNDFEGGYGGYNLYGDNKETVKYPDPSIVTSIPNIPQGTHAVILQGKDFNGNYFVSGFNQVLTAGIFSKYSPSDIYINVYIYGFPTNYGLTPKATKVALSISEDDDGINAFEGDKEDTFEQQVSVDWVGWKLVSVRYSNLVRSVAKKDGGSGNNIKETSKAYSVNVNLLSSPNGSSVGAAVDYLTVTFNKPLEK